MSGTFTLQQREVYEIVLDTHRYGSGTAIEAFVCAKSPC